MAQSSEVSAGDQGLASQYNNLRDDALGAVLTNKSGAERSAGEVVIQDTGNDSAFTTTTTEADEKVIGVVVETIANDASGLVQRAGACTVNVDGATARGNWLVASTTAGKATPKATFQQGTFAVALTASAGAGTVTALLLLGALPDQIEAGAITSVPDHDHTGEAGDGGQLSLAMLSVASEAQGDLIIRGASAWARLGAGTSGHFLKTQGAGANPVWAAIKIATGTYTGDGGANRQITTGFACKVVMVQQRSGSYPYVWIRLTEDTDYSAIFIRTGSNSMSVTTPRRHATDGFIVGSSQYEPNGDGTVYSYIAFG